MAELITERLRLRPVRAIDQPFVVALTGRADVRRFLGGVQPLRTRIHSARARLRPASGAYHWIIHTQRPGRRIGLIELTPHKDGADIELSYQLHPDAWGQGHATEAARAVLDHAQTGLTLPRIIAETQADNTRSCALLLRLGLREVARVDRFGAVQIIFATA